MCGSRFYWRKLIIVTPHLVGGNVSSFSETVRVSSLNFFMVTTSTDFYTFRSRFADLIGLEGHYENKSTKTEANVLTQVLTKFIWHFQWSVLIIMNVAGSMMLEVNYAFTLTEITDTFPFFLNTHYMVLLESCLCMIFQHLHSDNLCQTSLHAHTKTDDL